MYAAPPPDDAYIITTGSDYKHYVWPTLRGLIPAVNWHIEFTGDIDAPCLCRSFPIIRLEMEILWDALMQARSLSFDMLLTSGWRIEGEPLYIQTCSHDIDPRS